MRKNLPYGRQWIDENDIECVSDVLKTDWITQGPKIREFEQTLAEYCGAKYAVAVSSGTAALHIAVLSAGFSPGEEVITTPNTFVSTANSIVYSGATPIFADIKSDTYNVNPEEIEKRVNEKTKGLIPVDFSGQPCDIIEIKNIAEKYNLIIIEDGAQSLGAEYKDENGEWEKVGSCKYSDMTIFSFHPVKHITTGEGGMVLTNDNELYQKLIMLRTHGVTKDKNLLKKDDGPWYFEMQMLGFNYRITDFQCALGINQFKKLDGFIKRRREIVEIYNDAFKEIKEIIIPYEKPDVKSSYHLYVIQIREERLKARKREIFERLRSEGLGVNVHHIPVHIHPFYQEKYGYKEGDLPVAEEYYRGAISLPLYPKMSDEDVQYVIKTVKNIIYHYKKDL